RQGVQVTIAASTMQIDSAMEKAPFVCKTLHPPHGGAFMSRLNRAIKTLRQQEGYDVIHSMLPLISADVYQPRGGSVLYGSQRHAASFGKQAWWKRLTGGFNRGRQRHIQMERILCEAADGPVIAAVSNYVKRQYQDIYHVNERRLRVVLNGVDVARFRNEQARQEGRQLRRLHDRRDNKTLLLFAAENLRLKGFGPLLTAMERLPERKDICLLVISNSDYSVYWPQARRLNGRIVFMGGTVKMAAMMNLADAVVLPTWNDACSRVVMEALAAGKPALTTRYNGAAEFIEHGRTGIIIDSPDNVAALADGLRQLGDPSRRQVMADAIEQQHLYERVSMDRHAKELMAIYEEIIK
ncbi:MAG: glycosyltransferase family 4 protein, partial [Sedimentisphaerales bacterium]|nr:glycosyltransferase family 4 protein [Sedimentisphaerales bacterium]